MDTLSTRAMFEQRKQTGALLVLFGGVHCGVCQAIKPRLEQQMAEHYPALELAYIDCEQSAGICTQQGVFSLPVLKLFIEGQVHLEWARNFSLREVTRQIGRPYDLWMASR